MIYEVTTKGAFSSDFGLRDQIRRASGSIMHNIAEGFDGGVVIKSSSNSCDIPNALVRKCKANSTLHLIRITLVQFNLSNFAT